MYGGDLSHTGSLLKPEEEQHERRSHAARHGDSETAPRGHSGGVHHTGTGSAGSGQGKAHDRRHGHDHGVLPRARHNAADRQSDVEHHIDNMHATRGLHGGWHQEGAKRACGRGGGSADIHGEPC
jgi:hypothetical protein